ncbi:hypothetical protein FNW02_37355 [Komarekiella sp. 'clone 1']|uniref:Uncharacterized protein n=1 Tax=Komarekiella delphini-convector SJRDD-AB1 TaxID=2593771 RepID=A0AA40VVT5_9NOST|nr:hypothetical protein [Komarekiella delphini-convector]MBD6621216.1 hypothetical protein [Komarekiella delphini-convector SJRDD-AB1]
MTYYTANRCLLEENCLDESPDRILLPPTDPNAEVWDISGYRLVYCKGACPKVYRVYRDDSMLGLVFQHITHWANEVDKIRYAKPLDAAVALINFALWRVKPPDITASAA